MSTGHSFAGWRADRPVIRPDYSFVHSVLSACWRLEKCLLDRAEQYAEHGAVRTGSSSVMGPSWRAGVTLNSVGTPRRPAAFLGRAFPARRPARGIGHPTL